MAQSTSHTNTRPPGRSARRSSAERGGNVLDVLQYLHRDRPVEARVRDWERRRVRLVELDVVVSFGTLRSHGEHVCAAVHADDQAVAADHLEQFGDVNRGHNPRQARGRRPGVERSADQLAPAQHIARRVEPLQPLDETPA